MPKATQALTTSLFHNHSAGDLADQLGTLKAEIADLETRQKAVRDELIRCGGAEVEGVLFRVTVSDAVRWTLDAKSVRAEMGEDWWIARCRNAMVSARLEGIPDLSDEVSDAEWRQIDRLLQFIYHEPPAGLAGAAVKLRLVADPEIGLEIGDRTDGGDLITIRQVLALIERQIAAKGGAA